MTNPSDFQAYGTTYVSDCLLDDVYVLYRKLEFKHKPFF